MSEIRVMIAEDHKMVREGLKMIVDAEADMKIVGEANDGREAVRLAQELQPDVILMDISMPALNGLKASAELKAIAPDVKILTLTRHTDKAYLQELLQAGVSGYVLKQSEPEELLRALRTVAGGGNYLDPAVTENVFNLVTGQHNKLKGEVAGMPLTERESEVLRLVARGYSNKEIAAQLDANIKTIETQKSSAMRKLNIRGRNEIVNYAILKGWLQES